MRPAARDCCRATTTYPTRELPPGITPEEAADRFVLLCQAQAVTDITIETREVRPTPDVEVKSLPSRIDRMERLADDVMAVFLKLPAVEELHYRAGQYVDFILSGGRRRSFSLASAPADGKLLEVHVRRASSSGFTGQLFDTMRAGTLLRVEGPLGQFWFRGDSPRHAVMIGGGTGYAPLRAMLRQLLAIGDRRPITLYWGARTTQDLYEHDWLSSVATIRAAFDYRPVLSEPQPKNRHGPVAAGSCTRRRWPISATTSPSTTSMRAARPRWWRRFATRSWSADCRARNCSSTRSITRPIRLRRCGRRTTNSASSGACQRTAAEIRRVPEGTPCYIDVALEAYRRDVHVARRPSGTLRIPGSAPRPTRIARTCWRAVYRRRKRTRGNAGRRPTERATLSRSTVRARSPSPSWSSSSA